MRRDPLDPIVDLPGVAASAAAAREAVDRLLAHRVLRRRSAEISLEAALRAARASAELDCAPVTVDAVRSGAAEDHPVLAAALRVSAGLGEVTAIWERAPLQVLARLHVLAAVDRVPADRLGRPSGGPQTAARLDALARMVAGGTRAPAIVLAAIVHGELRALAPFGSADGIVARAASRLTLVTRGLDPKAVCIPEVGHVEFRDEYDQALAAYATATPAGVARWVRHCAAAVEFGAREGLAVCEALRRG